MNYSLKTNRGKRKDNQDYTGTFFNESNVLLAILCDGLGGHQAGDIASEMAVSQIGNAWEQTNFSADDTYIIQKWLQDKINEENSRIVEAASQYADLEGMGTTLVAASVLNRHILIANVGDSRAYVYKDGAIHLVTEDHSFVSELKRQGGLTEAEAENHSIKNALTRSLGVKGPIDIDFFRVERKKAEKVLLNSDGLSNVMDADQLVEIFSQDISLDELTDQLIETALYNEASDNITVNVIDVRTIDERQAGEKE